MHLGRSARLIDLTGGGGTGKALDRPTLKKAVACRNERGRRWLRRIRMWEAEVPRMNRRAERPEAAVGVPVR